MKKSIFTFAITLALACLLALGSNAIGAKPPGAGNGGGGGGEITDFGDLIILYRDDYGVPIPSPEMQVEDPETGEWVDGGLCWQPLAFNFSDPPDPANVVCPDDCVTVSIPEGEIVVAVDQYTCGVAAGCSGCTQEVDFGRVNEARSPDTVFESQLDDVIVNLSTADCLTLDPAGRVVASQVEDDLVTSRAIDSPLQNLAIYRELILMGTLGAPLPLLTADYLTTAARALGAASDKTGEFNVDMLAYLNQIMGLDGLPTTLDPKICETYREEVQGVIQPVNKCFLDYGDFVYNRAMNFGALPDPAYIPEENIVLGIYPVAGTFEYLAEKDPPTTPPTFEIVQGPITTAVFADEPGFLDGNIGGFAQAADDARAVINFMHSNPLPAGYETPLDCEASGEIFYDLSISEQSGLQVPKNYVSGGEREFFVNVTNLGPDPADGTVTVVATNGVELGSWTFTITDLLAGQTASFTQYFTITTTSNRINWSATVVADPPTADPNLGNNYVTASSTVRAAGGGGGGEH
jgi:hypothetical protein